jgi:hypothetical protein
VPGGLAANLREFDGGFWDVEIEDSAATIVRLIEGTVTVSREATTLSKASWLRLSGNRPSRWPASGT